MPEITQKRIIGHLMMFTTIMIYSFNTNFMKSIMPDWIGPFGLTFLRCLTSLIIYFIITLFLSKSKRKLDNKKDYWMLLIGGALGIGIYLMLYMFGLSKTGPVDVFVIRSSQPIFVLLISIFFLHKVATWNKIIGIILGVGGTIYICIYHSAGGDVNSFWGDASILLATIIYSIYIIFIKPYSERLNPFVVMLWLSIASTIVTLPLGIKELIEAPIFHRPFNWEVVGKISFTLLASTVIANILTVNALKYISSFSSSVYIYILPVTGTIVAVWLGLQVFTWHYAVAFGLIVTGFVLVNINNKSKQPDPHQHLGMH